MKSLRSRVIASASLPLGTARVHGVGEADALTYPCHGHCLNLARRARSPVHGLPPREGEQPRVLAGIFVQVGLGAWRKRRLRLHQTVDDGPRPALTLRSEDLTRRVV